MFELKIILAGQPPLVVKTMKFQTKQEAALAKSQQDLKFKKTGEDAHYLTVIEETK